MRFIFQRRGSSRAAALNVASFANETSCLRQSRHNQQRQCKKMSHAEAFGAARKDKKKALTCRAFVTTVVCDQYNSSSRTAQAHVKHKLTWRAWRSDAKAARPCG